MEKVGEYIILLGGIKSIEGEGKRHSPFPRFFVLGDRTGEDERREGGGLDVGLQEVSSLWFAILWWPDASL